MRVSKNYFFPLSRSRTEEQARAQVHKHFLSKRGGMPYDPNALPVSSERSAPWTVRKIFLERGIGLVRRATGMREW